MSTPPAYAELHALSNFSFLRGASHPQELVEHAAALGYRALALTDECSLAGIVRAHVAARARGFALIVGSEIRLADGPALVLLATDRIGYGNLSALITRGRRRSAKGGYHLVRADLEDGLPGCVALLLPDGRGAGHAAGDPATPRRCTQPAGVMVAPPSRGQAPAALAHARWLAGCFPGRAWIAVERMLEADDEAWLTALEALGRASGLPLVAAGDVHMHVRGRRLLQDTLTAIRVGTPLAQAGHALFANGERHLRARSRLARLYPPALLEESVHVAGLCRFSLEELRYEYPRELVPAGETPSSWLRHLTEAGAQRRWPQGMLAKVRRLIDHELALIAELGYEAFFLTVHDIVVFARGRGILCQGRGSAANSAVCFALGITEVDPARMEMLFERFISKERNEPPDIDVDFEHERREEVIQFVYARYGRDRAALAATVITYRLRSAIRDVGKALGMSAGQVDRLAKNLHWWDVKTIKKPEKPGSESNFLTDGNQGVCVGEKSDSDPGFSARLREVGLDPDSPVLVRLRWLVATLLRFPRHLSQHVGGMVIARGPLSQLVPIENAAMPERTVIQWDKDDLDALGLLKFDCLCLGMLSAIRRSFDLIADYSGRRLTLASVPAEDPATYAMIQRADTIGVFQIESRAQMAMLPRLKPRCYYDLVIEVAIIRPGPIQGEMVHPYLRRRDGLEPVTYPSEEVREVLARTLGVPLFQEQVIKLAMVAAGFSPGEADLLRRSMATWRRNGGLEKFRARLVEGMGVRGYTQEFAERIYQQILGFGEYGFPESHAASFALLAYVSAWLKCHEPAAFTAALLNSQPMGFYAPAQLVADARRHGVEIRPADVTVSAWDCALERPGKPGSESHFPVAAAAGFPVEEKFDSDPGFPGVMALRLGLRLVRGVSRVGVERLVAARGQAPFVDVDDLAARAGLERRDLDVLAAAGALRALAGHRHRARWDVLGAAARPGRGQVRGPRRETGAGNEAEGGGANGRPLPVTADLALAIAEAEPLLRRPTEGEDIVADYDRLGLTLGRHPLALLRRRLRRLGMLSAAQIGRLAHGTPVRTAGLVILRQRPGTATGVVFVTLEDETGHTNLIVWRSLVDAQRRELLGARLLGVAGEVQREAGVIHVVAGRLEDHSHLLGRLLSRSRDFH
ncbi:MAG: error-prone DNA polymerase [Gammaproteobacteria bacterium]|nr:error-prone DNA polymerase [Gammaproteobacteria bacterium]